MIIIFIFIFFFAFDGATIHFIPFNKPEPSKARQFRRVNDNFVHSLKTGMEGSPDGSY